MQLSLNSNPMRFLVFALLIQLAAAHSLDHNHTVNDGDELSSSQKDSLLMNRIQRWWYPNELDRPSPNLLDRLPPGLYPNQLDRLPPGPFPNQLDRLPMPDFQSGTFCKDQMAAVACYVKKCVFELIYCLQRLCDEMQPCREQHLACTKACFNNDEALLLSVNNIL